MINQMQDVSARRSLSTAYRIRGEVRGGYTVYITLGAITTKDSLVLRNYAVQHNYSMSLYNITIDNESEGEETGSRRFSRMQ